MMKPHKKQQHLQFPLIKMNHSKIAIYSLFTLYILYLSINIYVKKIKKLQVGTGRATIVATY